MPRRRRGSGAAAAEAERGPKMRLLLHSPKDTLACALVFTAVSAIVANALFLQAGRHPSPMFGTGVAMPVAGLAGGGPFPAPAPERARRSGFRPKARRTEVVRAEAFRGDAFRSKAFRAKTF